MTTLSGIVVIWGGLLVELDRRNFFPMTPLFHRLALFTLATSIHVSSVSAEAYQFEWDQVPIGGGGRCMDAWPHPNVDGLVYARTDVGGLFRMKPGESRWTNVTHFMPVEYTQGKGVDGIALDLAPGRESVIYAAFGRYPADDITAAVANGLWRSEDSGDTWTKIFTQSTPHLERSEVKNYPFGGNTGKDDRFANSCIAVDPFNSDIVYVGTRNAGLWRSMNATSDKPDFEKIENLPLGVQKSLHFGLPSGVRIVQPDPFQGTIGEGAEKRAKVVYALVRGNHPDKKAEPEFKGGVFKSEDGGETYELLDQGDAPYIAYAIRFGHGGRVYASGNSGVVTLTEDGSWKTLLKTREGPDIVGFDVQPGEPDKIVAFYGRNFSRSIDGGTTWEEITRRVPQLTKEFWMSSHGEQYWRNIATGARFDPHKEDAIWLAEPYGPFYVEDIFGDAPQVFPTVAGYELLSITSIAIADEDPDVVLYASMADIGGVVVNSLEDPLAKSHLRTQKDVSSLHNSPQILTVPGRPNTVLWLQTTGGGWENPIRDESGAPKIWRSVDQGRSWTMTEGPVKDPESPVKNNAAGAASLALSPFDPNHAVFAGANRAPHVTRNLLAEDGEIIWEKASGVPIDFVKAIRIFAGPDTLLRADPVKEGRFYLTVSRANLNRLYVSEDGGLTWDNRTETPWAPKSTITQTRMEVAAVPTGEGGKRSEVWVSSGDQGLWVSRDGAVNFGKLDFPFNLIEGFAFGAPAPGSEIPALYVLASAQIDGQPQSGVYLSLDLGETFELISDPERPMFAATAVRMVKADQIHFGRLFIATGGTGVMYGQWTGHEGETASAE